MHGSSGQSTPTLLSTKLRNLGFKPLTAHLSDKNLSNIYIYTNFNHNDKSMVLHWWGWQCNDFETWVCKHTIECSQCDNFHNAIINDICQIFGNIGSVSWPLYVEIHYTFDHIIDRDDNYENMCRHYIGNYVLANNDSPCRGCGVEGSHFTH